MALSSTEENLLLYHLFERLGDVARAEPFCSVSMRRVEVLNHRLLPGIADPSLEVNQASASAKDK